MSSATALLVAAAMLLCAATFAYGRELQQFDELRLRRLLEAQRTLQQQSPPDMGMWKETLQRWNSYGERWKKPCPDWIQKYTSQAAQWTDKLFIQWCSFNGCCGIGDRIRALEDMMRTALLCKRAMVVKWEPVGLEDFFEPASPVDWRPLPKYNITRENIHTIGGEHFVQFRSASVCKNPHPKIQTNSNEPFFTWENATNEQGEKVAPYIGDRSAPDRSCTFNALFKPKPNLMSALEEERKKLFGDPNKDYIAVHLRFGGLAGETLNMGPEHQMRSFVSSVRCAKQMATYLGITAPVLVIVDNTGLRSLIANGQVKGVVGPTLPARHISSYEPKNKKKEDMVALHTPTFVDMALMAKARCVFLGQSGFSNTAVEWGRPPCFIDPGDCIRMVDQENAKLES